MIRPGHHRPLGTTTWMRFPDWPRSHPIQPALLDLIAQRDGPDGDPDDVQRAYEVFGIFETRGERGYRLHCERVEYERFRERWQMAADAPEPDQMGVWTFQNLPRR